MILALWPKLTQNQCTLAVTVGVHCVEEYRSLPLRVDPRGHLMGVFIREAQLKSNTPIKWPLRSALRDSDLYSSIHCTPTVTARVHWFCTNLGQKAKNRLNLGENALFTRFLMCPSINFFWVSTWGSKSSFLNPKLGARLKKYGFEGSQVHSQKVYRWTHPIQIITPQSWPQRSFNGRIWL